MSILKRAVAALGGAVLVAVAMPAGAQAEVQALPIGRLNRQDRA